MASCDTTSLLEQIEANILARDDTPFDEINEHLKKLQALADVYSTFVSTAHTLTDHAQDHILPQKLALRVKKMIKFTFGDPSRAADSDKVRSARLRKLDCNALKFCGLAYKVNEVCLLSELHFDLLLEKVTEFVCTRGLIEYLYRDDISKAVTTQLNLADEERDREYQKFLIANISSRPLKRSRATYDGSGTYSTTVVPNESPSKRQKTVTGSCLFESYLGSEVFVLTMHQVEEIIQSGRFGSDIRLIVPIYLETPPFITIPIANDVAIHHMTTRLAGTS
ncbi:uncharacterized protein CC84DRAFT_1206435 [Paraphaeosphaeria sporulosa]|uniref:Uncharacterized protein n=1 Tax=Paraphaeosphaeria sporulosa TaxID=1460663 RepID=A0A177CDM3_9PLEO|nr:uncharacterized protein CC84DRAFT_1206435 [Paraphaeosphaeria sporulosa]OAG04877.1 hypothetical protein CC84DRAFT_1206435 [Paraphaeosphaeria sporulosa]